MKIEKKNIKSAANAGLITTEQAEKLWIFLKEEQKNIPTFRFIHILYYLGGLIAISAVTIFVTNAWDKLQGIPLLMIALALFCLGLYLTHYFLDKALRIPAGIMATFSLALVPLMVYNIQFLFGMVPPNYYDYSDFHYWIDWYWLNMEWSTIPVGVIMFAFYRFPFLLFPISWILWYMSMDLVPYLFRFQEYTFSDAAKFSMFFGLFVLVIALLVDFNFDDEKEDYAFWLYIFGVIIFWSGLSSQSSTSELSNFFYCLINVGMLFASAILNRRVFAVFGALGIIFYLSHLVITVFADSLGFPVVLIMIGIIIIFAAVFFTRVESKINAFMRPYIPQKILNKMKY